MGLLERIIGPFFEQSDFILEALLKIYGVFYALGYGLARVYVFLFGYSA